MYSLAVSKAALSLLQNLFSAVKEDALRLLMSIWALSPAGEAETSICTAALHHSLALFKAFSSSSEGVDFQTVLPSLVVLLANSGLTLAIRAAAVDCVRLIASITSSKAFDRIYGFDIIYGDETGM